MKPIIRQIFHCRCYYAAIFLLCILLPFSSILAANAMSKLTEVLAGGQFSGLAAIVGMVAVGFTAENMINTGYFITCGHLEGAVYSNIQKKNFDKFVHLSIDHPMMTSSGNLYNLVMNDSNEVTCFLSKTIPEILMQAAVAVLMIGYLTMIDLQITGIYLVSLIASLIAQDLLGNSSENAKRRVKESEIALNESVQEILTNRVLIKCFSAYEFGRNRCRTYNDKYEKSVIKYSFSAMPLKMMGIICGMVPILSVSVAGLYRIQAGTLGIGTFFAVYYLCEKLVPKQLHYVDLLLDVRKTKPACVRMAKLWEAADKENAGSRIPNVCFIRKRTENGSIELNHVWYHYPGEENWALQDISLKIAGGRKVAFVGESGSGKSTATKLISGLLDPVYGKLTSGENRITRQFPFLFRGSVKENIELGITDPKEWERVCQVSQLTSLFPDLEMGMDLDLTENGGNLSGGQRQRIAIARALYTKAPVLLFDETTSALDTEAAMAVIKEIFKQYPDRTILFVLHQSELLPLFDEIYEFEEGHLISHRRNLEGSYEQ